MFARRFGLMVMAALALAVAGCQSPPPAQRQQDLSFRNETPFRLDLARVEVVPQYVPPADPTHIESDAPLSPMTALNHWAQDRLIPIGRTGLMRLTVRDAQLTETPLKMEKGFVSHFERQQEARFDCVIEVTLEILDERGLPLSQVNTRATHSHTITEGTTLNDRDRILFDLVKATAEDVDHQLDALIRQYMARWIA